ncbi:hypothetical protein ATG_15380 [Desulfurococcaceae archaeon AG1]|nr:hypothetical protein ATG_15380 [Desulfurococcaceae archaeon AG1]
MCKNNSRVIEVLPPPEAPLTFYIVIDYDTGDSETLAKPPLGVLEYDKIGITMINWGLIV